MATMTMALCDFDTKVQPEEIPENFLKRTYFVRGICFTGSRHYSENVDWEDALDLYSRYRALVGYFGGGRVELIEEFLGEASEVYSTWVSDMED